MFFFIPLGSAGFVTKLGAIFCVDAPSAFIPSGSSSFVTCDGATFTVRP